MSASTAAFFTLYYTLIHAFKCCCVCYSGCCNSCDDRTGQLVARALHTTARPATGMSCVALWRQAMSACCLIGGSSMYL